MSFFLPCLQSYIAFSLTDQMLFIRLHSKGGALVVTRKHCNIVHSIVNTDFLLFIHSHSQHHTPGTSPYVTPVIKHLVIPILLFSTQTSPHESIQQSPNNNLTLPLRKSCLFRLFNVYVYITVICNVKFSQSRVRVQSTHRLLSLPPCSLHVK